MHSAEINLRAEELKRRRELANALRLAAAELRNLGVIARQYEGAITALRNRADQLDGYQ